MPLFNDWGSAEVLLQGLDAEITAAGFTGRVLIVDDCSSQALPESFRRLELKTLRIVEVLHLRRNLGHQREIAVGLVHVHDHIPCRVVVVMDADGQDRPSDARKLLEESMRSNGAEVVFAARSKRLESLPFRILYHVYRWLHLVLTGAAVRVGNFSAVPYEKLTQLAVMPELWNHYAAAVIRSRIAFRMVPIPPGARLLGESRVGYAGLLLHGLSAFFVYGDIIGARLLAAVGLLLTLAIGVIGAEVVYVVITGRSIPQWGAFATGVALIVLLQAVLGALVLVFTVIGSRVNLNFLPVRDCPYFVKDVERMGAAIDRDAGLRKS
jgi:uncharacterized membrane protein YeaQ/YmgE (transglycosylase-associated protein family)